MSSAFTSSSTSISLIKRVRTLEPEAWQELLNLYGPLVYRWARNAGLQSNDAADVLQNVFVSVMRAIERFSHDRPDASFRGWLWTITRNAVREFVRRRKTHPLAAGGSDAVLALQAAIEPETAVVDPEEGDPIDADALLSLTHRALNLVKQRVDPQTWDAFWRTTVAEEPAVDVAAALGMSPTAVRQAKFRVLCRLRELLADS